MESKLFLASKQSWRHCIRNLSKICLCFVQNLNGKIAIVENPGISVQQPPSSRLGWTICSRWKRAQSETSLSPLWTAAQPHVMAACHTFSIAWVDTLWFLALTGWGSSSPPGELFISHSPSWTVCIWDFFPHLWQISQKSRKWEWRSESFHETVANITGVGC